MNYTNRIVKDIHRGGCKLLTCIIDEDIEDIPEYVVFRRVIYEEFIHDKRRWVE